MTNKEIKRKALTFILAQPEKAFVSAVIYLAAAVSVFVIEALIYRCSELFEADHRPLSLEYYLSSGHAAAFAALRALIYFVIITSASGFVRRSFINGGDTELSLERFIAEHPKRTSLPEMYGSLKLMGLKLLVLSPLSVGVFGIYHYMGMAVTDEINLMGLMLFMFSISFSIVWTGFVLHYYMSLFLVKYIIALNPRTNFFDACDLSVKLMEGKHSRLMSFYLSFLPFLPFTILLYPLLILCPYLIRSKLILAEELMGDRWQDKLPAMARRWEKQQKRKNV